MEHTIAREPRPAFHLSARVGWMNDPNGFSFYQGKYHLFYQYHPYDSHWGPMHWGHAISKDLLCWKHLPIALAPDFPYDKDGCFSGSAIELDDHYHLLMYTGVVKDSHSQNSKREIQTQCIAIGNGINYEKYPGNPVLTETSLPQGSSQFDFRDPKLWRDDKGVFHCVVGNCTQEKQDGQILVFKSEDCIHWSFEKILAVSNSKFGSMWECPDYFELDGKQVILVSPPDIIPQNLEYTNGHQTICFIGQENIDTGEWTEESNQSVDYGIDFYASQTILTPDGRRIMIAWMQNWYTSKLHSKDTPWFGQMTLPRELSIKNGRLYQKPVRELEQYWDNKIEYHEIIVNGVLSLEGIKGRILDMELNIKPKDKEIIYRKFEIQFAKDNRYHTSVTFRPYESEVTIDRTFSGSCIAAAHQRRCQVNCQEGRLKLRLILDRFSAEVFINDGEYVMTITIQTDLIADSISFFADETIIMDIVKYNIKEPALFHFEQA